MAARGLGSSAPPRAAPRSPAYRPRRRGEPAAEPGVQGAGAQGPAQPPRRGRPVGIVGEVRKGRGGRSAPAQLCPLPGEAPHAAPRRLPRPCRARRPQKKFRPPPSPAQLPPQPDALRLSQTLCFKIPIKLQRPHLSPRVPNLGAAARRGGRTGAAGREGRGDAGISALLRGPRSSLRAAGSGRGGRAGGGAAPDL